MIFQVTRYHHSKLNLNRLSYYEVFIEQQTYAFIIYSILFHSILNSAVLSKRNYSQITREFKLNRLLVEEHSKQGTEPQLPHKLLGHSLVFSRSQSCLSPRRRQTSVLSRRLRDMFRSST